MRYIGVGRRFVAIFIDGLIALVWTYPFLDIQRSPGYFRAELNGFPFLAVFVIWLAYFTVMEGLFGATVGKFATGIRVRRPDGRPIDFGASLKRNLARIIDSLPFLYLVGAILVWTSPMRQRLGDRWASTVVVPAATVATGLTPGTFGIGLPPVPGAPVPAGPPPMPPPPPLREPPVVIPEPAGPAASPYDQGPDDQGPEVEDPPPGPPVEG
jgi:uncharacterized RDD family membrane protein YckC